MKILKITAVLILSLFVLLGFSVFANNDFDITVSGDFYTATNNASEIATVLGLEEKELGNYLAENNIVFEAVSRDGKREVRLQSFETQFSASVFLTVLNISASST